MPIQTVRAKQGAISRAAVAAVAGPPVVIVHMRDAAALMVRHLSRDTTEMAMPSILPIGNLATEARSGRNDAARVALEVIQGVGDELLKRCANTILLTREIRASPDAKKGIKPRKVRSTNSEDIHLPVKSSEWLSVKEASRRFPFTESAIRHMIFEAEATKHGVHSQMRNFLDVIVRVPGKRRVLLNEKKFLAWMTQAMAS